MWIDCESSHVCIQFNVHVLPEPQNQHYLVFLFLRCCTYVHTLVTGGGGSRNLSKNHKDSQKSSRLLAPRTSPCPRGMPWLVQTWRLFSDFLSSWVLTDTFLPSWQTGILGFLSFPLTFSLFLESFSCSSPTSAKPFPFLPFPMCNFLLCF